MYIPTCMRVFVSFVCVCCLHKCLCTDEKMSPQQDGNHWPSGDISGRTSLVLRNTLLSLSFSLYVCTVWDIFWRPINKHNILLSRVYVLCCFCWHDTSSIMCLCVSVHSILQRKWESLCVNKDLFLFEIEFFLYESEGGRERERERERFNFCMYVYVFI